MGTVRELYPSEWLPSYQLGVFFNPDAPRRAKDAAIETFQWPWPKLSQETLAKLDALQPDHERGKDAAIQYLNAHEPTVIPIKASVGLPVVIIIFVVIALAIAAKAMV